MSVSLPNPASREIDVEGIVRGIVAEFNSTGYAGEYGVIASGNTLHVVPVSSRSVTGARAARRSLLDREVVIAAGRYTGRELLQIVLDQVNEQQEFQIVMGTVSSSAWASTTLEMPEGSYMARDVLLRINASQLSPISWSMLFEPMARQYYLNIHGLMLDPYAHLHK